MRKIKRDFKMVTVSEIKFRLGTHYMTVQNEIIFKEMQITRKSKMLAEFT